MKARIAKQIALIEAGLQEKLVIKVGEFRQHTHFFKDARDAVRAYYLLSLESAKGNVPCGECFNIAGEEAFKFPEIIEILLEFSNFEGGGGGCAIRILEDSDRFASY